MFEAGDRQMGEVSHVSVPLTVGRNISPEDTHEGSQALPWRWPRSPMFIAVSRDRRWNPLARCCALRGVRVPASQPNLSKNVSERPCADTRSSPRSSPEAWSKDTGRGTRGSRATWRSSLLRAAAGGDGRNERSLACENPVSEFADELRANS
jgi:hypothetical protein